MVYKNAAHTLPTMFFPGKPMFLVAWTTPKIRNTCLRLKKMAQLREWLRFLLCGLSSLFYFSIVKGSFLLSSRTNAVGKSSSGNGCGGDFSSAAARELNTCADWIREHFKMWLCHYKSRRGIE